MSDVQDTNDSPGETGDQPDPLGAALGKVEPGAVEVRAPEWARRSWLALAARTLVAVLLLALVAVVVWHADDELPGESGQQASVTEFAVRATEASVAAAKALSARREAGDELRRARARVADARTLRPRDPEAVRAAQRARAKAAARLDVKVVAHRRRVAERDAALGDVLAVRPNTDGDLVRIIGVGALALVALVGAGALLAPRRSQLLTVRSLPEAADPASVSRQAGSGLSRGSTDPGAPVTESPPPDDPPPAGSSVVASEPTLTQGLLASAALIGGLFGIQELEGTAEAALNVLLPLVPIVGALFARSRVAPKSHLRPSERSRLFPAS